MLINIWNTVYPILIAILCFELIIVIHEGGHFVAARMNGIKVNEFSIGMGPKIIQFGKKDTKYTLRLFLIGGYCSMEGEDEESNDENSFSKKAVWRRIIVVVAGAVMNLLLGLVLVLILVSSGNLVGTNTIAKFDDNAVSSQVLMPGDTIKSIDGMRVFTAGDVTTGLARSTDEKLNMVVLRNGEELTLDVPFNMQTIEEHEFIDMDFFLLGKPKTFANVITTSFKEWVSIGRSVFLSLHDLIVGKFGVRDLSGPVGVVGAVSTAVKTNIRSVIRLIAMITINVGVFNLFPIPALDGWRLFLLVFEGITKKKMPDKYEWAINAVGLILLIGLMTLVTFSDITKLF